MKNKVWEERATKYGQAVANGAKTQKEIAEYMGYSTIVVKDTIRYMNTGSTTRQPITIEEKDVNVNTKFFFDKTDPTRTYFRSNEYYKPVEIQTMESMVIDIMGGWSEKIQKEAPVYSKKVRKKGEHSLIINPADIHVGKLGVTNEKADAVCDRVKRGAEKIISQVKSYDIAEAILVIGNDCLHVDNVFKTTTKGTPQDTICNWMKAQELAFKMYKYVIEYMMDNYNVKVIHNFGNHDQMSSYFLAQNLKSWFRNSPIKWDISQHDRKYHQFHKNLYGFTHGDNLKAKDAGMVMATERSRMWAETQFRTFYFHHIHHKDKKAIHVKAESKDYIGYKVEYVRSPSTTDKWHHDKAYLSMKCVEGFLSHKEYGQVNHVTTYF